MSFMELVPLKKEKLKNKFLIAVALTSIIPLLVVVYFVVNYVFGYENDILQESCIVGITVYIVLLGFLLLKRWVNIIVKIAEETKQILEGRYDQAIEVESNDELGEIAISVNTIQERMKVHIEELEKYAKNTEYLKEQINRKTETMGNLGHLGEMVASGADLGEIFGFAAEKLVNEIAGGFSCIFIREESGVYDTNCFINNSGRGVSLHEIALQLPFAEKEFEKGTETIILEDDRSADQWQKGLRRRLEMANVLIFPIKVHREIVGMVLVGNFLQGYKFKGSSMHSIQAFVKLVEMGYQASQMGSEPVDDAVDSLTGLYTRVYLESSLEEEINRATFYQRPCSLMVMGIDGFDDYMGSHGEVKAEQVLKQVAKLISGEVSPVARAARFGFSEFGIILPEKNKRECIDIAERIRGQISALPISDDPNERITVSIGVGENPIDGAKGKDILDKATQNLMKAKEHGRDKVVGD